MVTDVDLYNKSTNGLSLPITTRMRGTTSGFVYAKLQVFFEYANTAEDESSLNVDNANPGEQKVSLSGEEHGVKDAAIDLEKTKSQQGSRLATQKRMG